MKHFAPAALLLAFSGFLLGQEPNVPERLDQLRKDFPLVEALVNQGIRLADDTSPLNKARSFQELARALVEEIRQAANHGQESRALRMGDFLQSTLEHGLADNLAGARHQLGMDTAKAKDWRRLGEEALELTQALDPTIERPPTSEHKVLQSAGRIVQPGRAAIRKVLQGERSTSIR